MYKKEHTTTNSLYSLRTFITNYLTGWWKTCRMNFSRQIKGRRRRRRRKKETNYHLKWNLSIQPSEWISAFLQFTFHLFIFHLCFMYSYLSRWVTKLNRNHVRPSVLQLSQFATEQSAGIFLICCYFFRGFFFIIDTMQLAKERE